MSNLTPTTWPKGWRTPTPEMITAIHEACSVAGVPEEIVLGMIRKESNFNPKAVGKKHGGNNETYRKSYAKYKDQVIPGKNPKQLTWGDMFTTPESWKPYSLCQMNPYHLVGVTGGTKAGASLSDLFKVRPAIQRAVALLAAFYRQTDSWDDALRQYNGSTAYVKEVNTYVAELKNVQAAIVEAVV